MDKLQAILLLEADLNGANKTFFGSRMVSHLESTKQLPEELYAKREIEAIKDRYQLEKELADIDMSFDLALEDSAR